MSGGRHLYAQAGESVSSGAAWIRHATSHPSIWPGQRTRGLWPKAVGAVSLHHLTPAGVSSGPRDVAVCPSVGRQRGRARERYAHLAHLAIRDCSDQAPACRGGGQILRAVIQRLR